MSAPHRVSVIVPTHDRLAQLGQALESIRALDGPDLSLEIIVADNGTKSAAGVAAKYGAVHVTATDVRGAGAARNAGMRRATGEFIAFLDDDDQWLLTHVREHLALFDARPDLAAVMGRIISVDYRSRRRGHAYPLEWPGEGDELVRRLLGGFFPQIGAVIVRRSALRSVGYFDEALIGGEDLDWLLRFARRRQLGFVPAESVLFTARPYGAYDRIQFERLGYDRRVFLRHALPEWRIWKSPRALMHAYYGTMRSFYRYFSEAVVKRAARGERSAAWVALWGAFRVFPLRTTYHILAGKRLGIGFVALLDPFPRRRSGHGWDPTQALLTLCAVVGI